MIDKDETKQAGPTTDQVMGMAASRQSGRTALLELAARREREAAALRRLADALPREIPAQADEALWTMVMSQR